MLHEMNSDDRNASFSSCFASYNGKAVYIQRFTDEGTVYIEDSDGEDMEVDCFSIGLNEPEYGMVQIGDKLFYAAKQAARQWRRGVNPRLLTMYRLEEKGSVTVESSEGYKRTAIQTFIEGRNRGSKVIDRDFGITDGLLYFRTIPIGTVDGHIIQLKTNCQVPRINNYVLERTL